MSSVIAQLSVLVTKNLEREKKKIREILKNVTAPPSVLTFIKLSVLVAMEQ